MATQAYNGLMLPRHHVIGHYRFAVSIASTAAQAANSRLLELRNTHARNLIIPTVLKLRTLQNNAGTAQLNAVDAYRVTGFTAVDTTNTVTPASSVMSSNMPAFPGGAAVRHLTLAGNVAGMTGGTLTKDAQAFAQHVYLVASASQVAPQGIDALADIAAYGAHPFMFAQNEGLLVESRVLNVTTFGVTWFLELGWAEIVLL